MIVNLTGALDQDYKDNPPNRFRVRVDGLGVHTYGRTAEEAKARALSGSSIKLDMMMKTGRSLKFVLQDLGVNFENADKPGLTVNLAVSE